MINFLVNQDGRKVIDTWRFSMWYQHVRFLRDQGNEVVVDWWIDVRGLHIVATCI